MTTAVIFLAGPMPDLDQPGRRVPPVGPVGARPDIELPLPEPTTIGEREGGEQRVDIHDPGDRYAITTLGQRLRKRITVRDADFSIAADGGLDLALGLGYTPRYVIGDMDSVTTGAIETARDAGSSITVVPRAKDSSDFELALDNAVERGASHLVVVGGAGGRLDHVLATVLTLTAEKYSPMVIEALLVDNYVAVIHGGGSLVTDVGLSATAGSGLAPPTPSIARMDGLPGEPVSLFALNGPADDVHTTGLAWSLEGERLEGGTSRGVSNELASTTAAVAIGGGCLAVVRTAVYEPVESQLRPDIGSVLGTNSVRREEKVNLR